MQSILSDLRTAERHLYDAQTNLNTALTLAKAKRLDPNFIEAIRHGLKGAAETCLHIANVATLLKILPTPMPHQEP